MSLEFSNDIQIFGREQVKLEIHVHLYSILREMLPSESRGKAVVQMEEEACLQDLLDKLGITRKVVISVNGVQEMDKSRRLKNGDIVKMFSSISGG